MGNYLYSGAVRIFMAVVSSAVFYSVFCTVFCALSAGAEDFKVPALSGPVVDEAGLLSVQEKDALQGRARDIHKGGGPQVQIYIATSTQGLGLEEFSLRVVEAWKLGGETTDNGMLILVVPSERKIRFEVGYGLEGTFTDALTSRWIRNLISPSFRQGRYAQGLWSVLAEIEDPKPGRMGTGKGEPPSDPSSLESAVGEFLSSHFPGGQFGFLILLVLLSFFVNHARSPWSRRGTRTYGGGFPPWSGGGGGWGGGGGGWSGGGGSFGGGGSSGSW